MKIIILDRDGVINEDSDAYIKSHEEWVPITGSIEAIVRLGLAGFTVVVVTNQSGLARGLFSETALSNMHHKMSQLVEQAGGKIDNIFYCPHGPSDGCDCRKPKIGLLKQIEKYYSSSVRGLYFIGDNLKDIEAAKTAQCIPLLVKTGKGISALKSHDAVLDGVAVFPDLSAAVDRVLQSQLAKANRTIPKGSAQ